jgi:amino acid transporter
MFKVQHDFFKSSVFFFGMLLLIILFLVVGGVGNSIGEQASKILIYIGYIIGIIFVFLLLVFVIGWIRDNYLNKNREFED